MIFQIASESIALARLKEWKVNGVRDRMIVYLRDPEDKRFIDGADAVAAALTEILDQCEARDNERLGGGWVDL